MWSGSTLDLLLDQLSLSLGQVKACVDCCVGLVLSRDSERSLRTLLTIHFLERLVRVENPEGSDCILARGDIRHTRVTLTLSLPLGSSVLQPRKSYSYDRGEGQGRCGSSVGQVWLTYPEPRK